VNPPCASPDHTNARQAHAKQAEVMVKDGGFSFIISSRRKVLVDVSVVLSETLGKSELSMTGMCGVNQILCTSYLEKAGSPFSSSILL
jgi:hypothetical protein